MRCFVVLRKAKSSSTEPSTLAHGEVFTETTHSGLCGTDEHYLLSGQVLGHECVGIVKAPRVLWLTSKGQDQFCRKQKQYGFHDFSKGTSSYSAVWDAKYVYPIPDGYSSVDAAPMMCAGATVWTALAEFGIRPGDRVAIMGIGGLGHLAIKLTAALGYHVVVLSSSDSKRQEALGYGASEYHVFQSCETIPDTLKPVDHLLLCGNAGVDYAS
ncbi:hypothetical protein CBS147332_5786 [Penicillium roqueforti]|nr:hypothetical protein CBS147332_5786 [Penicillium roqueforti]KAI3111858.1 hypothetical protein CBS147331_4412 [Penicillium roqueforti]